jgi:hypothetical protein
LTFTVEETDMQDDFEIGKEYVITDVMRPIVVAKAFNIGDVVTPVTDKEKNMVRGQNDNTLVMCSYPKSTGKALFFSREQVEVAQ